MTAEELEKRVSDLQGSLASVEKILRDYGKAITLLNEAVLTLRIDLLTVDKSLFLHKVRDE